MTGYVLDAGALIAVDRGDRAVLLAVRETLRSGHGVVVPAGVIAQVWRDGRKQARLAQLLASPRLEVEDLDDEGARAAGALCGAKGTADIVDASVALCARRRRYGVMTSDPNDISRLDGSLRVVAV